MLHKEITKGIKGIAAVFIMIGHLLPDSAPDLARFFFYGPIWVGIFFFISGYGTRISANSSEEYYKGFVLRKIKTTWIPFAIAEIVYLFSIHYMRASMPTLRETIGSLIGCPLSNDILWYVIELLILELLFWVFDTLRVHRYKRICYIVWIICYLSFLAVSVLFDIGTWWYVSTITFGIGVWIADNEETAKRLLTNRLLLILLTLTVVLLYTFIQLGELKGINVTGLPINMYITGLTMIEVPLFTLCFIGWMIGRSKGNGVLLWLGAISYYIYLYHIPAKIWVAWINKGCFGETAVFAIQVITTLVIATTIRCVSAKWGRQRFYT